MRLLLVVLACWIRCTTTQSSPSASASESQSQTISPTSPRPTSSQTSTRTRSTSQTRTRSPSLSRTSSGFPLRPIVDNTHSLSYDVSQSFQLLSDQDWSGIVLFWPEIDPQCGPGRYDITSVFLPLTAPADGTYVTVVVLVSIVDPATLQPTSILSTTSTTYLLHSDPSGSYKIIGPGAIVDTIVSQYTLITWHVSSGIALWHDMIYPTDVNGTSINPTGLPSNGFARPLASVTSTDGGVTFVQNATYGGIFVQGRKLVCSPTPTQTQSMTQSRTPSMTPSASATASLTPSSTPSQARSPTPSNTPSQIATMSQTSSQTATQSGSPSQAHTPTQTQSQTPTRTATGSQTQSRSDSQTRTASHTPSQVVTASPSQVATPSQALTLSGTGSRSQSQSASLTSTQSQARTSSPTSTPSHSSSMSPSQSVSPSATASQATSGSSSGTPSESVSRSQSASSSISGTPTPTSSSSQTITPSQSSSGSDSQTSTASLSATPSSTLTSSPTGSPSQTPTMSGSQSPSSTSYPVRFVIDNTAGGTSSLSSLATFESLYVGTTRGVSWRFLENDASCGPGIYNHVAVTLALSEEPCVMFSTNCCNGTSGAMVTLSVLQNSPGSSSPISSMAPLQSLNVSLPLVSSVNWVTATFPPAFEIAATTPVNYTLALSTNCDIRWYAPDASVAMHVPSDGTGTPLSVVLSNDGGTSWTTTSLEQGPDFMAIEIVAVKAVCSPSSTRTPSQTSSQSRSAAPTPSQSLTTSPSLTPSESASQSTSPSATTSGSASPSQYSTSSSTGSKTQSQSATQSMSSSQSCTPSTSASQSQTRSQSNSQAVSYSGTPSQTQSRSQLATDSSTPSQTPSGSPSETGTRTQSATQSGAASRTPSLSSTRSATTSGTETASSRPSPSESGSLTSSNSFSQSSSVTVTPSVTQTQSLTGSSIRTSSQSASQSRTPSQVSTGSPTPSPEPTPTPTVSSSQLQTQTSTQTSSLSATSSQEPTASSTRTGTSTASVTLSQIASPSETQTSSASHTPSQSHTASQAMTSTGTETPSVSISSTQTTTPSPTTSPSVLATRSQSISTTASQSRTRSATATPTCSISPTQSQTASESRSQTYSATLTQTVSVTPSSTQTSTLTPTSSPSQTLSPSVTSSSSQTLSPSPTQTSSPSSTPSSTALPCAETPGNATFTVSFELFMLSPSTTLNETADVATGPSVAAFSQSATLRSLVTISIADTINSRLLGLPAFGTSNAWITGMRDAPSAGVALNVDVSIYLQPRSASSHAAMENVEALIRVRYFFEHAAGSDLLGAFLASKTSHAWGLQPRDTVLNGTSVIYICPPVAAQSAVVPGDVTGQPVLGTYGLSLAMGLLGLLLLLLCLLFCFWWRRRAHRRKRKVADSAMPPLRPESSAFPLAAIEVNDDDSEASENDDGRKAKVAIAPSNREGVVAMQEVTPRPDERMLFFSDHIVGTPRSAVVMQRVEGSLDIAEPFSSSPGMENAAIPPLADSAGRQDSSAAHLLVSPHAVHTTPDAVIETPAARPSNQLTELILVANDIPAAAVLPEESLHVFSLPLEHLAIPATRHASVEPILDISDHAKEIHPITTFKPDPDEDRRETFVDAESSHVVVVDSCEAYAPRPSTESSRPDAVLELLSIPSSEHKIDYPSYITDKLLADSALRNDSACDLPAELLTEPILSSGTNLLVYPAAIVQSANESVPHDAFPLDADVTSLDERKSDADTGSGSEQTSTPDGREAPGAVPTLTNSVIVPIVESATHLQTDLHLQYSSRCTPSGRNQGATGVLLAISGRTSRRSTSSILSAKTNTESNPMLSLFQNILQETPRPSSRIVTPTLVHSTPPDGEMLPTHGQQIRLECTLPSASLGTARQTAVEVRVRPSFSEGHDEPILPHFICSSDSVANNAAKESENPHSNDHFNTHSLTIQPVDTSLLSVHHDALEGAATPVLKLGSGDSKLFQEGQNKAFVTQESLLQSEEEVLLTSTAIGGARSSTDGSQHVTSRKVEEQLPGHSFRNIASSREQQGFTRSGSPARRPTRLAWDPTVQLPSELLTRSSIPPTLAPAVRRLPSNLPWVEQLRLEQDVYVPPNPADQWWDAQVRSLRSPGGVPRRTRGDLVSPPYLGGTSRLGHPVQSNLQHSSSSLSLRSTTTRSTLARSASHRVLVQQFLGLQYRHIPQSDA